MVQRYIFDTLKATATLDTMGLNCQQVAETSIGKALLDKDFSLTADKCGLPQNGIADGFRCPKMHFFYPLKSPVEF